MYQYDCVIVAPCNCAQKRGMGSRFSLSAEGAAAGIPNDLLIEILLRLPATTVLRFRRLSKCHQALIDSPDFVRRHSDLSIKTTPSYVINPVEAVVGSCKGILCSLNMMEPQRHRIMLWNPLRVRSRNIVVDHDANRTAGFRYSLGYDAVTDDLKLLKTRCMVTYHHYVFEVYSSRMDSWKTIKKRPVKHLCLASPDVFVEGSNSVHMLGSDSHDVTAVIHRIVAFNFATERFNLVPLPSDSASWKPSPSALSSLDNCLCFCRHISPGCLDVWMMKEYGIQESWAHFFSFDQSNVSFPERVIYVDCVTINGHKLNLFSRNEHRGMSVCNLAKKVVFPPPKHRAQGRYCFSPIPLLYTPSLRLP